MDIRSQAKLSVESYYDQWTDHYIQTTGEYIQALRPASDEDLLKYYIDTLNLAPGQRIIDAGCGVGSLAIGLAKNCEVFVDGITISQVQADLARASVSNQRLKEWVRVTKGDYHMLEHYYPSDQYDAILFVESMGHSAEPEIAIKECSKVLKEDGFIYIKDFFKRESENRDKQSQIEIVVQNINRNYAYQTLDLNKLIGSLRKNNFWIDYIRKPNFEADISARAFFETKYNINIFENVIPFYGVAEWLEIKCTKNTK